MLLLLLLLLRSKQALKVKDKDKTPLVRCVTDGCRGYTTFLATLHGPLGQEMDKYYFFQPNTVRHHARGRQRGRGTAANESDHVLLNNPAAAGAYLRVWVSADLP
jgi:hypothetical protein